jgi:hypothetical protein
MPYIGNPIYQSAFVTDQFSGNGSTTAFTMSVAPAGVTNVLVAVSGVLQDPSTYGVVGNTITFSAAPPSGTGNISCRYLGVPASGVTTTAYRTVTEFTATASQTTFTPPSYTVGFINVYLNGVLLGSADYTATNGTTVVLAVGASAGNLLTVESFLVSSVLNAIPNTAGAVSSSNIVSGVTLTAPNLGTPASGVMTNVTSLPAAQLTGSRTIPKATLPTGSVLQVVQGAYTTTGVTTSSTSYVDTGLTASITPTSSSSNILVIVQSAFFCATGGGSNNPAMFGNLVRGSTQLQENFFQGYDQGGSGVEFTATVVFNFLDSPATTSSTTYKTQVKRTGNGSELRFYTPFRMTLMEIAA